MPDARVDNILHIQASTFKPASLPGGLLQPVHKGLTVRIVDQFITPAREIQDPLVPETPCH